LRWFVALVCRAGEVGIVTVDRLPAVTWLPAESRAATRGRFQVEFSPDGQFLVALAAAGGIEVWPVSENQAAQRVLPSVGGGIWSFVFSTGRGFLATTSTLGTVAVWDVQTGAPASPLLTHPGWVYRAAFSPDESRLVTACHDGYARVWDWRTGTLLKRPLVHLDRVLDAVFTADNRWIITACRDGFVRVWDPESGDILMPPAKVGAQALNVELAEAGQAAVVGSLGGPVHVLPLADLDVTRARDPRELEAIGEVLSCGEIRDGKRREFTAAEWLDRFQRLQRTNPAGPLMGAPQPARAETSAPAGPPEPCGNGTECENCPEKGRGSTPKSFLSGPSP
jgi:hypothetical protein